MDPLDDLDSLLDLENELLEESEPSQKRSRADLQSRQEAAASLAGAVGAAPPGSKRARVGHAGAASAAAASASLRTYHSISPTEEDQELLDLFAEHEPGSQTVGAAPTTTVAGSQPTVVDTEVQETEVQGYLAMAAASQPSQSLAFHGHAAPSSRLGGGAGGGSLLTAAAAGGSRGGAGGGGLIDDDDDWLNDVLNARLDEEQGGGAAAGRPSQQRQPQAPPPQPPQQQQQGSPAPNAAVEGAAAAAPNFLPRRQYVPPAREVFRIRGASLTVTSESGERVYCQLEAPQPGSGIGRRQDLAGTLRRSRGGLLSESITSLLAAVEKDQYDRAVAETAAASSAQQQQRTPGRRSSGAKALGHGGSSLWVQKYTPRGYIDLLSDEQINREVVRWLKSWDPCVFGTATPAHLAQQAHRGNSRFQQQQQQHGGPGGGGGGIGEDPLGRPEHKIILIAGPPGLGKTTLAHVCAAHCGYRPVEINASDDRSAGALQARILDAVEMQSVMGQRRPNCVIIDEIDGATGGAEGRSGIAALLKIVNATPGKQGGGGGGKGQQQRGAAADDAGSDSEEEEGEEGDGTGQRGGRGAGGRALGQASLAGKQGGKQPQQKQLRPLMRPIICICNDLYAPALRPLRDVARVFHFKKPQPERLAQRLQSICGDEGLRCEKSTLRLLVERTDCDIRSCLNTLQFLAKRQSFVRLADLEGLRVGQKDMTKGAFSVWTDLLQKRKAPGIIGKAAESEAQRSQRLFNTLQDFGESDLVLGGVHENVLGLRYFDMALQRTTSVLNSLGDSDRFLRACHRGGDFSLLKYVPAPMVALSNLVAGPDRPQLQWPRAALDCQRRSAANRALLQGWMLGMSPAAHAATSSRSMVLEVLPFLMHIAAPSLRPVSQHLYSPQEQEIVRQLVDTLLCYNIRYCLDATAAEREAEEHRQQQQQAEAGGEQQQQQGMRGSAAEPPLRFRPAVHRTCTFAGMAPKGKLLPSAVRQTVSHEADMEAIRRAEVARRGGPSAAQPQPEQQQQQAGPAAAAAVPAFTGIVPVTLAERMKAAGTARAASGKAAAPRKGTWLDQLKEQREARAGMNSASGSNGVAGKAKFAVLYCFHEGYTNAVKRPVKLGDLL